MIRTLNRRLEAHVEHRPDKVFWRQLFGGSVTELTFAQFHARASSFANAYAGRGLEPGQVALIFLPRQADAVAAFFGAMLIGAIPSFMPCPSARQHPSVYWPAHRALLRRIGPHVLVSDRGNAASMREHGIVDDASWLLTIEEVGHHGAPPPPFEADADAVALLQHSSGTTSLKKGVALSHRAILLQADLYAARLGMGEADRVVSWLPLYHDMGLIACTLVPLALGQTVTCLDPFQWIARPASLFDAIEQYDGQFVWMPNFAFEHLARSVPEQHAADLSRMRAFVNCSEPCKAETFDRFAARFARLGVRAEQLQVCYAMAETVFAVSQTAVGERAREIQVDLDRLRRDRVAVAPSTEAAAARVLSTGRPLPGIDVRIQDDGRDLPDGAVGEVVLSGAMLFDGYFNDEQATRAVLRDGRCRTRDRGFMRDGELYVLGRMDDLLIVNGRNLHAHEVEALIGGVSGAKPGRAVAFGVFNEEVGSEELVVVAERDTGAAADPEVSRAIRRAVHEQTNIEVKICRIVDPGWLVKTTSGKISREANREKHLRETAAAAAAEAT